MNSIYHFIIYHGGFANFLNSWFLGFAISIALSFYWSAHGANNMTDAQRARTLIYIASVFLISIFFAFVIVNGSAVESKTICETIFNKETVELENNLCLYEAGNLWIKIPIKQKEIYSLLKDKYIERNEFQFIIFNFYEQDMGRDNPIYFAQRNKEKIVSVFKDKKESLFGK